MKILRTLLILSLLITASGCATVYNPAVGRSEAVFINTAQEVGIGSQIERSILRRYKLSEDLAYMHRVNRIGRNIAAASDRQDLKYKFFVIESKDLNAFTIPGGSVFVTTGLLNAVDNDDELACVIGHEVGHIAARHPAKRLEAELGYSFLTQLAYALDARPPSEKYKMWQDITRATDITFKLISLGYNRRDEILADELGATYAERARYDPNGAITFLKKLQKKEKDTPEYLVFLRSHPYVKDRIIALKAWMSLREAGSFAR